MPIPVKKIKKYERTLTIYANQEEVADNIQEALQKLINKAKPSDIKNLANALSRNPEYIDVALKYLPAIK